jgi:DNA-binding helix-hairpin-helix protein with protein kinase domain
LLLSAAPLPIAIFINLPIAGRLLFLAAAVGLYFVARTLVRATNDTTAFAQKTRMDLEHLEKVRNEWQSVAGPGRFDAKRAELDRLRRLWTGSRDLQARKQRERDDHRRIAALARHLDTFAIEAGVPRIASSRVTLLESFGIHTAADVTTAKLEGVPNLDAKLRDVLNEWRRGLEDRFRKEAAPGPVSLDEKLIEREALAEQMRIEAALRTGLQDLQEIQKQALFARVSKKAKVEEARNAYLQSAADLKAVTR